MTRFETLTADDDPEIAQSMAMLVEPENYLTEIAHGGETGLKKK